MTEKTSDKLEIAYEYCATSSFLAVKAGMEENILDYQVSMLENNRIERIIPFELKRKNGCACFYYNITSKLALSFFLKRKKLKRNEFIRMLSDIARTLLDSTGYLLNEFCFIMDTEYMYINPETLELSLIYVPVTHCTGDRNIFRDFIIDLILNHANIDEYDTDNFLQRMLAFVKNDLFNLIEFSSFLESLLYSRDSQIGINVVQSDQTCSARMEKDFKEERQNIKNKNLRPVVIILLTQLAFAVVLPVCGKYAGLTSNDPVVGYAAVALIVVALDILLFKNLFSKMLSATRTKSNEPAGSDNKKMAVKSGVSELKEKVQQPENEPLCSAVQSGNTVLLSNMKRSFPILRSKNAGEFEDILIDKPDFVIGRLAEQVDYVSRNNAVGKVHSQVINREGIYCIKDLNSINGTFLNDSRIESNKEYEMKDNDIITFANSEYVFLVK